jgi:predicted nucleic acid-binding protein
MIKWKRKKSYYTSEEGYSMIRYTKEGTYRWIADYKNITLIHNTTLELAKKACLDHKEKNDNIHTNKT